MVATVVVVMVVVMVFFIVVNRCHGQQAVFVILVNHTNARVAQADVLGIAQADVQTATAVVVLSSSKKQLLQTLYRSSS